MSSVVSTDRLEWLRARDTAASTGPASDPTSFSREQSTSASASSEMSLLYSRVVGSDETRSKLPLLIARDLEERFIRDGWPAGRFYGGEIELAEHYHVCRDVAREAVRILESRDSARMRRGPNGGLELICPSEDHIRQMIGGYAFILNLLPEQLIEAWSLLHAVAARLAAAKMQATKPMPFAWHATSDASAAGIMQLRRFGSELVAQSSSQLLQFLCAALVPLLPPAEQAKPVGWLTKFQQRIQFDVAHGHIEDAARRSRLLFARNELAHLKALRQDARYTGLPAPHRQQGVSCQALTIVQKLLRDVHPADWENGRLLGNEFDLCDRYNVHRSVIRQAIRMMEDAGTATTLPGRGHGLVASKPGSAPLSRQICNFLGSRRFPTADASRVADGLQIEMAALAAHKSGADDAPLLSRMYEDLQHLDQSTPISYFQPFERWQLGLARNPLLSVFVDGTKAFLSWDMAHELVAPYWIVSLYVERTRQVINAIQCRDWRAAARMQELKLKKLQECRSILEMNRFRIGTNARHHCAIPKPDFAGQSDSHPRGG